MYNCYSCVRTCTILHVLIVPTYCYWFTRFSIYSDCSDKCEVTSVHLQTSFTDGNEAIAIIVYTYTLSLSIQSQQVFEANFVHTYKASIFFWKSCIISITHSYIQYIINQHYKYQAMYVPFAPDLWSGISTDFGAHHTSDNCSWNICLDVSRGIHAIGGIHVLVKTELSHNIKAYKVQAHNNI